MTLLSGSPQPHDIGHAVEHLRSRWPWFAAFGAISLLLGVALVATGALRLFLATRLPEAPRWQVGVAGALTAVLGVLIVFGWPQNSPYVLGIFLGVDMMMYGAGQLGFALFLRRRFRPFV
ncbi:MAG: hypothetical protein WBS22_16510 [Methylocystis sp.]